MEERYIPHVKDMIHDIEVKKYDNGVIGEYFCNCIYCRKNFIGYKHDYKCQTCEDGLTP